MSNTTKPIKLDATDRKILYILQGNAKITWYQIKSTSFTLSTIQENDFIVVLS